MVFGSPLTDEDRNRIEVAFKKRYPGFEVWWKDDRMYFSTVERKPKRSLAEVAGPYLERWKR